jgi:hypothetical protein
MIMLVRKTKKLEKSGNILASEVLYIVKEIISRFIKYL